MEFKLLSPYKPIVVQPEDIDELSKGIIEGLTAQTLLGVTCSGKCFTVVNLIELLVAPNLVMNLR